MEGFVLQRLTPAREHARVLLSYPTQYESVRKGRMFLYYESG